MRMIIELKRDAQPMKVLNNLFKHTALQQTFGVNMLALVEDGTQPRVLTLKRALQEYVAHRQDVITRRTEFELERARRRAHILEGLKIALDHIDEIIATIRASRTTETARTNLMNEFKLSEMQANAILDMRLARLAALERKKIEDELKEVRARDQPGSKICSPIRQDPRRDPRRHGSSQGEVRRRARARAFRTSPATLSEEDLIPEVDVLVTLTKQAAMSSGSPTTSTAPSIAAAAASPA